MNSDENLEKIRHSLAHLLAAAVQKMYPDAMRTLGPAIENGFYYDFEFSTPISDKELPKIEKEMRRILKTWKSFEKVAVDEDGARKEFKDNPYKLELINEIVAKDEALTLYKSGDFVDLCRGGHIEDIKEINPDAFTLDRVAGAYWRGDENNTMLTRIYGLAFNTKEELEKYKEQQEEAIKRDHRKLGKELELFTILDEVGPGLPLFYPKGTKLRNLIENFVLNEQEKRGYVPIWIPHITKGKLYEISGHLEKYDAMFSPMKVDDEDYYVKPMNCPHFMMLYKSLPHSYRELPLRYTSMSTVYRNEKSGELSGLNRVRALTQDDCHVFCTTDQIKGEIELMLDTLQAVYKKFGLEDFWVSISLRDNSDKYIGDDATWNTAEDALRSVVKDTGWKYEEIEGEAAFYGPKLDFMFKDALGRTWQLSTIQLDFNLPNRFELEYTGAGNTKERPVVIHRALLGSTERFLGIIIEHFAGAFPLWLAPVQVWVLPISEKHKEYAGEIAEKLRSEGIRVELRDEDETLGKKIRETNKQKIPYFLVIGDQEIASAQVTVESRDKGKVGEMGVDEFLEKLKKEEE